MCLGLCRERYLYFTSKYTSDRDARLQSYHDALMQVYQVIINDKFDPLKSKLKTFIFHIGKNKLLNILEKERTHQKLSSVYDDLTQECEDLSLECDDQLNHMKRKDEFEAVFSTLSQKYQELLTCYYYDALDSEEIKNIMGYDNVNVVYSVKSRCIKKIRDQIRMNRLID